MSIVKNIRTLKGMEKEGLITLHPQTGTKVQWYGQWGTAWYVDDYKNPTFEYKGKKYEGKYVSGCFYPYIMEIN